jgi:hypothetical protein
MEELRSIGRSAFSTLGDQFGDYMREDERRAGESGLDIVIETLGPMLLWEFLYPVADIPQDRPPLEYEEVDWGLFWGCQHRVTRKLTGQGTYYESEIDPGPFLFCRNSGLAYWNLEQDYPDRVFNSESFPRIFLKLGATAVIATACDVPDRFAAEFANKFYEFFFAPDEPITASEALRLARRYFLEHYRNPLGLAYGLYAHENLTISW